jgi:hypothetical protein
MGDDHWFSPNHHPPTVPRKPKPTEPLWTLRKANGTVDSDSTSTDFKDWANHYLLPALKVADVTADALWGARCALLHAQAAESGLSRSGNVPEIWYRWNDRGIVPLRVTGGTTGSRNAVMVRPRDLIAALETAIANFLAAIERDPGLRQRFEKEARKLWVSMVFPPQL